MIFFKKLENNKIECLLCGHSCKIEENKIGFCGVNLNKEGKLVSLNQNNPSSIAIDPIEKKPLYHVLPASKSFSIGGFGCNFKCPNCQNYTISQKNKNLPYNEYSADLLVNLAKNNSCQSMSYTYNEPSISYPFVKNISIKAKEKNLLNIFVSNGFMSEQVIYDMKECIDALNIDLKSFQSQIYKHIFKGNLDKVLNNLILFKKLGFWIEITTLIIEGFNDSESELNKISLWIVQNLGKNVPWHISAFYPAYKMLNKKATNFENLQMAYKIAKSNGLNFVYLGNVNAKNPTICPSCKKELITRNAYGVKLNNFLKGYCLNCKTFIEGIW